MSPQIVVLGSLNMDLVLRVPHLPQPGETLAGHSFAQVPGGTGANQAVAMSKLGARVRMVGRVGEDAYGAQLVESLTSAGVDAGMVARTAGVSTGLALIFVEDLGENVIVLEPGANQLLADDDVRAASEVIQGAGALLLQLEVPLDTVLLAAQVARGSGVRVILNAAPARPLPDALLALVDVLLVNETELTLISGSIGGHEEAARLLLARGAHSALVTLGREGSLLVANEGTTYMPAFAVEAVDTTAAGDAFTGAYVVALLDGSDPRACLRFASAAAAIKVTRYGAQPGFPSRREVEDFLAANG
jgi:ribokinase